MKTGANRLTLSNAGNSYAGETRILEGTLQVGDGTTGAIPSSSTITVSSGASMNWVLGSSLTLANTITGSGNIGVTLTGAGSNLTIAASPVLTGTGTFTAGVAGNIIVNSGSSIAAAGGIIWLPGPILSIIPGQVPSRPPVATGSFIHPPHPEILLADLIPEIPQFGIPLLSRDRLSQP